MLIRRGDVPDLRQALCDEVLAGLTSGLGVALGGRGGPERRLDWVREHRRFLWPDVRLDFERHRYLLGIYEDEHPYIVIRKAAQLGLSEWAVTDAFWCCDVRGANVLYLLPGTKDVRDFSTTRVGLAIEASPYLAGIISPDEIMASPRRKAGDRQTLKRVRNRFLYLRHGSVRADGRAPQLKVAAIDVVELDELDEMDRRTKVLAQKRLGHSPLGWLRLISTPTLPDFGIDRELQETDRRVWTVKCGACNEWQALDPFANLILEMDAAGRPARWFHAKGQPREPFVGCRKCNARLDVTQGEWVATYPGRDRHGYEVNKLASPVVNLYELIRAGQTLDENDRKEWWNQDLGVPYQPRGGGFDGTVMRQSIRDYRAPATAQRCAMGVDVGKVLHVVIRQWFNAAEAEGGKRLVRRAVYVHDVAGFEQLDELMRRYDVRVAIVDALPETREAMRFVRRWPWKAKVAYYAGGAGKHADATREKPGEEFVIELDRTRHFDALRALYEGGEIWNAANLETDAPDFLSHFGALTRVVEAGRDGNPVARWVNSRPDHFAHADLYCNAALDIMGPIMGGESSVLVGPGDDEREALVDGEHAGWDLEDDESGRRGRRRSAWQ